MVMGDGKPVLFGLNCGVARKDSPEFSSSSFIIIVVMYCYYCYYDVTDMKHWYEA